MPLRHAAPSPLQVLDLLHRLAKAKSTRSPDFLSGYAYQDGKCEHRGDVTQEVDLICGICGAYEGNKTAEVRDVRKIRGGRGLCGRPGKRVNGVFVNAPSLEGRSRVFNRLYNKCVMNSATSKGRHRRL